MIEISGLDFSYGKKKILEDISFSTEDRRTVSILGPNGAGKTTLLKCICGQLKTVPGVVKVDGQDVSGISGRQLSRSLGYVPQHHVRSLDTVFDSILIGRRPYVNWTPRKADIEIVWRTIRMLKMEHIALSPLNRISGGELQKVGIARAMVQNPSTIILDEPTNNLDVANQHMIMHMLNDIATSNNLSFMMTMHDINLAAYYSDYLIFLSGGQIVASGSPEIITPELILAVYGIDCNIEHIRDSVFVIPKKDQPFFTKYDQTLFSDPTLFGKGGD